VKKKKKPGLLASLIVNTLSILIVSYLLTGVQVSSIQTAILVAIILGVLNVTVKPFLILITIPITIMTLGLFLIVINVIVLMIADSFIGGFNVNGFLWAVLFSVLVSIVNGVLFELSK
jgi:putative membrane protein